ncbi:MAG: sulfite exporter TauE/SafE family protein [Actinobacteria bacterium]|nr:sulfite exporter TauE/SafE family protein [Actinomycetota bacterium]
MSLIAAISVGLLIGSIAGMLAGIFGIGGGIVIVPMLVFFLKFTPSKAVGTSLASMLLPVGILAVMKYSRAGDVDFRVAGAIALGIFVLAFVGAHVGLTIGGTWVSRGFGVLLLVVGFKFLLA